MSDLVAARLQMAISLGFHILFAVAGIAMPLFMVIAEARWLRSRDPVWLELARRWAKGTAVLFAVGAVSGTVLTFELGLLWPRFMAFAGPIFGLPFALEGFAFFLEAIFLGIYLYGWDRVAPRLHLLAGAGVAVAGMISGVFVVIANGWMNTPTGFAIVAGRAVDIDPIAAMRNPAALSEALHMTIAAYLSVGLAVAAIHAFVLLREPASRFHRAALAITLPIAAVCAPLQLVSGDLSAKQVARDQPVKLAAMEGQFETERGAPLRIGGLPDPKAGVTRGAIELPGMLSWLGYGDTRAVVRGLNEVAPADRPPVVVVHLGFQIMVACGTLMIALAAAVAWTAWRRRKPWDSRWLLRAIVACGPLGFIALEAGWTVTEVGRQPWIVGGVMRTRDALTSMPGLAGTLTVVTLVYLGLGLAVIALLRWQVFESTSGARAVHEDAHAAG